MSDQPIRPLPEGQVAFVVIGVLGEYSERRETVRGVFTAEQSAVREMVERKTREVRSSAEAHRAWYLMFLAAMDEAVRDVQTPSLTEPPEKLRAYRKLRDDAAFAFRDMYPEPPEPEADCFYVAAVRLDEWGAWDRHDLGAEPT